LIEEQVNGSWLWVPDAMLVPDSWLRVVKTMDATVPEMGPGDTSFGNDQETLNRQGHFSW
tara:strand:- start:581 stop:760 length:180 start_codon:yes stop_codon:yes gene_type:complete